MLRLYLAEKEARLSADTEITLKLTNEWFKDRETEHSFPFTLKLEANRHIFGFPERPGNHALSRYMALHGKTYSIVMPAFITYGGVTLLYGSARITSVSNTEVELFCYSGEYDFWKAMETYRLGELPEGIREMFDVLISNNGRLMDKTDLLSKLDDYSLALSVKNAVMCFPKIYDPTMSSIPGETAQIHPCWLNYRNGLSLESEVNSRTCVLLPCPNMSKIMEIILECLGYSIKFSSLASGIFPRVYIVSRRTYISLAHYTSETSYPIHLPDFLPDITFREFLEEIERKFCVLIQPLHPLYSLEGDKKVNIVSFDNYINNTLPIELEVLDDCEKEVLENDDIVADYRFTDEDPSDDAINGEVMDVEPISLEASILLDGTDDNSDGVKNIECISAPIAKFMDDVDSDYKGVAVISSGDTGNIDINNDEEWFAGKIANRNKEFRIGLSKNGINLTPEYSEEESLKWEHLRKIYYSRYDFIHGQFMCVEFILKHPVQALNQIKYLFSRPIIVRNLKFLVVEQNVTFKGMNVEYRIKCYPVS